MASGGVEGFVKTGARHTIAEDARVPTRITKARPAPVPKTEVFERGPVNNDPDLDLFHSELGDEESTQASSVYALLPKGETQEFARFQAERYGWESRGSLTPEGEEIDHRSRHSSIEIIPTAPDIIDPGRPSGTAEVGYSGPTRSLPILESNPGAFEGSEVSVGPEYETVGEKASVSHEDLLEQRHKRPLELDYKNEQLQAMSYSKLVSESFDYDPTRTKPVLSKDLSNKSLQDQLKFLVNIQDQQSAGTRQCDFFASLPIDKYEESGELITQQFSELLHRYTGLRQEKRKVAQEFEAEVARREEMVRERKDVLEADLKRLKKSGEDVIKYGR